jgi:hypothetical protein
LRRRFQPLQGPFFQIVFAGSFSSGSLAIRPGPYDVRALPFPLLCRSAFIP